MARGVLASIESMASQAESLVAQGHLREAEQSFRELIAQTHVIDYEYDDWLRRLADIYVTLKRNREAGTIYLYLHYFDLARSNFPGDERLAERARVAEVEKHWSQAAELYSLAKMPIHSAVAWEKAAEPKRAAMIWEQQINNVGFRESPYEKALVYFNYGMALRAMDRDSAVSRRALIDSQRVLEQVADDFESVGQRELAFDCYQILLKLGLESEQYENLAEGYLNSIRVLREDGLKFYVLQYYEDFIALSQERGELHAVASLYQEAADFSSRNGLPYHRDYQAKAAVAWAECAEQYRQEDAPVELAENAFLAAISCYSAVGDYKNVRTIFIALSKIDLGEQKSERYQKIAARYENAAIASEDSPAFPDYLKQQHAYADIWFVDLLEWELNGNPSEVAMSILGDLRYPDAIRRRALVIVLTLADAARHRQETGTDVLEVVTELLGELQSYAALSPLESLYRHSEPPVRRAAIRALRFLFFKRSFALIQSALRDEDETVRFAAVEALRGLHFPHAFNPLTRIYRDSEVLEVRTVALQSIGKIQSIEAGEFLLSVLRQESTELREVAIGALATIDNADLIPIIRQYQEFESNPVVREALEGLLHRA